MEKYVPSQSVARNECFSILGMGSVVRQNMTVLDLGLAAERRTAGGAA
jgi:hypothetical protein